MTAINPPSLAANRANASPDANAAAPGKVDDEARAQFESLYGQKDAKPMTAAADVSLSTERAAVPADAEPQPKADDGAPARFDNLYGREQATREHSGRGGDGQPQGDGGQDEPASLADLMSSLYAERREGAPPPLQTHTQNVAAADAAPAASASSAATVENLLRQILVSPPDSAHDPEVRLLVQDALLPDTEIRLTRGVDGLLTVTLATGRDDAFQTLVTAQDALRQRLNAHEPQGVRLTVLDTRADADTGDGRSRGYRSYTPDDGDGDR
jgi:type III secretion system needle length determinant